MRRLHPVIFGHVSEVHKSQWYAVYFYVPVEAGKKTFDETVTDADRLIGLLWREPACRHHGSRGRDNIGNYFYTFWLPVLPAKRSADFANFYPSGARY
ncbi:MAG: hypothetical protein QOG91_222 [Candidatus Parcubacteria bacterium]|jgi:hypothetical protein|nr:hypothetical protein [Candidatus Parcubacteria bacterium]